MVDRHVESACEVLSQKAMLWSNTDHVQGADAFSTPKIAPATPMQAWKKPLHRQESPDALPTFSLGRSSAELKAASVNTNVPHSLSGPVGAATLARFHSRTEPPKENLLAFSLSSYEKMVTPMRNHMGPSSLHRVCAPSGDSKILPIESMGFPLEGHTPVGVGAVDEGMLHAVKSEPATNDVDKICRADDSAQPCSPVPGVVANDAYELYSKLFPSAATVCLPFMDVHPKSSLGQIDSKTPLPADVCGRKSPAVERYAHLKAPGGGHQFKLSTNEHATSNRFLMPKEEPVFEEPYGTQELSGYGDACLNSTWKDHSRPCKENVLRDFTFLKSSHIQPGNLSASLMSPATSKAFDHIVNSGDGPMEVKPAAGLKLSTLSEDAQLPPPSLTLCAGKPSHLLTHKIGACESPAQGNPSVEAGWGKFLALSATPSGNTDTASMLPFQHRFKKLQAFLKQCDDADHNERVQGLRSLSVAARSGYAIELETRAIHLSLEEGKELKRMRLLNVLGRASESHLEESGATPLGPRLPVLGAASPLTHAP